MARLFLNVWPLPKKNIYTVACKICQSRFNRCVDQDMLAPDFSPPPTSDFSGKVGLNLALRLVISYKGQKTVWLETCTLLAEPL